MRRDLAADVVIRRPRGLNDDVAVGASRVEDDGVDEMPRKITDELRLPQPCVHARGLPWIEQATTPISHRDTVPLAAVPRYARAMTQFSPLAEHLSRMIQIPTVADRDDATFEAFVALIEDLYPNVHAALERERITDRGLLFRWRGARDKDPLVLMAHYDVVPADSSEWGEDPFSGRIENGVVHGRGALDDKGPLLVILEAVESLLTDGFSPARDVYLSFGGNEESFGAGAAAIVETLRSRSIRPWLVLDEGGAVVDSPLPYTAGSAAMIGTGEKGQVTLKLTATSEPGHASAPRGISAIDRLARATARLTPATFRPRTPEAIVRMLHALADRATGPARIVYRLLSHSRFLAGRLFAALGGEPAALVRTTIAATLQTGGSAPNVLPASASVTFNLRIIPGESVDSVTRRVRRRIGDSRIAVSSLEGADPTPLSPVDAPQFELIAEAVGSAYPDAVPTPYLMMQASDARYFHAISDHVYRFAPLTMTSEQRASIHGIGEHVSIDSLERGRAFHAALIRSLT
ncbi:peptidase M20 [Microbacterium nanhaiense]|uniref:Peptidase M20 n=2 Tax=Microbacterium nanhaiense TaxID=1301026 RepID=A0ABQ2N559_9MICO|nr:peptidase M20 [Microbacterium nanhaiense]